MEGGRRCFGDGDAMYARYHDEEWGRPVRDERGLYERLCLEAFQSGLSWLTILRKRENFRRAFGGFDPAVVAAFTGGDIARLLADSGIVRNRAKIEAAVANARAVLRLRETATPLPDLIWAFRPDERSAPREAGDVPTRTPESVALARALKRENFLFVGPTTTYALMQAAGLVNDHLQRCAVRTEVATAQGEAL